MIAAVFYWEWARAGRGRWLHYARWIYGAWLAFVLLIAHDAYYSNIDYFGSEGVAAGATARFARQLVDTLLWQQTWVVLLIAPALAGGSITDEKTHGTLESLLLTHLSPAAIVLGKWAALVAQSFLWSLAAWPILALVGIPAGLAPVFFLSLALTTLFALSGLCAVSLLASVWARSTRGAVVLVYALMTMAVPIVFHASTRLGAWQVVAALNPNFVLDTARDEPDYEIWRHRLAMTATLWGTFTVVNLLIAMVRLKPAYVRHLAQRGRRKWYWFLRLRPSVTDRPLEWKELHVARWPAWVLWFVLAAAGSAVVIWAHQLNAVDDDATTFIITMNWFFIAGLVWAAGVSAAGAITAEREQHTWDSVLSTPYHFAQILDQKCSGILNRFGPLYFAANFAASLTESIVRGGELLIGVLVSILMAVVVVAVMILSQSGVAIMPWGLALFLLAAGANAGWWAVGSMWGAVLAGAGMYVMIRFGHYMSARSRSGWLALLATMVLGQFVMLALVAGSSPISGCLCIVFTIFTWGPLEMFGVHSFMTREILLPIFWSIGWVIAWIWGGQVFYRWTNTYLERTERIPGHHVRMIDLDLPYKPPREGEG